MRKSVCLMTVCTLLGVGGSVHGAVYDLGYCFNGTDPTSTAPWLTASFDDRGSVGSAYLTLTSHLDVPSEYIAKFVFNINPFDSRSLTIKPLSGPAVFISVGENAKQIDGTAGAGFDVLLSFPTAQGQRFEGDGTVATFLISMAGLDDSYFDYPNTGSAQAIVGAAIQGIPQPGGGTISGDIMNGTTVPEPTTLLVWSGLGAIGAVMASRRKRRAA